MDFVRYVHKEILFYYLAIRTLDISTINLKVVPHVRNLPIHTIKSIIIYRMDRPNIIPPLLRIVLKLVCTFTLNKEEMSKFISMVNMTNRFNLFPFAWSNWLNIENWWIYIVKCVNLEVFPPLSFVFVFANVFLEMDVDLFQAHYFYLFVAELLRKSYVILFLLFFLFRNVFT